MAIRPEVLADKAVKEMGAGEQEFRGSIQVTVPLTPQTEPGGIRPTA
jgi:hypothetical protein